MKFKKTGHYRSYREATQETYLHEIMQNKEKIQLRVRCNNGNEANFQVNVIDVCRSENVIKFSWNGREFSTKWTNIVYSSPEYILVETKEKETNKSKVYGTYKLHNTETGITRGWIAKTKQEARMLTCYLTRNPHIKLVHMI